MKKQKETPKHTYIGAAMTPEESVIVKRYKDNISQVTSTSNLFKEIVKAIAHGWIKPEALLYLCASPEAVEQGNKMKLALKNEGFLTETQNKNK